MKIGLVLPSIPSYSETFFYNKINGLIKSGHSVLLFVNVKGNNENSKFDKNIKIYVQLNVNKKISVILNLLRLIILNPIRIYNFYNLEKKSKKAFTRILRNIIINSHILVSDLDWLHFGYATMGIDRENVSQVIQASSSVSLRGYDIGLYPYKHIGCYDLLWDKIDRVHSISDDLYQSALSLGLKNNVSYKKIMPAIDTTFFNFSRKKKLHDPIRILTVGRLNWKKGYDYSLKAMSILKEKQINFQYKIIGDGNYDEAIIYAINQLKLTNNVQILGKCANIEVKKNMEWADIYIQPSIQEGFCNSVLEAQAMGLLCIVTNAEGLEENIINGKTGWVIDKRSYKQIYQSIRNILLLKENQLNYIRKSAVDRVKKEFNLAKQEKLFLEFFNNE